MQGENLITTSEWEAELIFSGQSNTIYLLIKWGIATLKRGNQRDGTELSAM